MMESIGAEVGNAESCLRPIRTPLSSWMGRATSAAITIRPGLAKSQPVWTWPSIKAVSPAVFRLTSRAGIGDKGRDRQRQRHHQEKEPFALFIAATFSILLKKIPGISTENHSNITILEQFLLGCPPVPSPYPSGIPKRSDHFPHFRGNIPLASTLFLW